MKVIKPLTKLELTRLNELLKLVHPTTRFDSEEIWGHYDDSFGVGKTYGDIMLNNVKSHYRVTYGTNLNLVQYVVYNGEIMSRKNMKRLKAENGM